MENNKFLETFKKIINECRYDSTYKMAWAKALVEISKYKNDDSEYIDIYLDEISKKVIKYYWDQIVFLDVLQGRNLTKQPVILQSVNTLIEEYYRYIGLNQLIKFEQIESKLSERLADKYLTCIKDVTKTLKADVSWRFIYIDGESHEEIYRYYKEHDKIVILKENIEILKENRQELINLINLRWKEMIKSFDKNYKTLEEIEDVNTSVNRLDGILEFSKQLFNKLSEEDANSNNKNSKLEINNDIAKICEIRNEINCDIKEHITSNIERKVDLGDVNDNDFNVIISEIKQLLRANKLIGNKLIENYDNDEFFDYINKRAEKILMFNLSNPYLTIEESYEVIISLSFIALKFYTGNFWENVNNQYEKLYTMPGVKPQKIRNKIVEILKGFRGNDKRYIEYPIKNAIVPYTFLDKYYDFMFDIYRLNFKESLPENLIEEVRYIFEAIYEKINADSDELNIEVTNKTYKLIKSTQNIIKNEENLLELCELSANVLERIQAYIWNYNTDLEDNSYFNTSFERFLHTNRSEKRRLSEFEKKEYQSRWKPTFRLINNEVYLITPIHKVDDKFDPTKLNIWAYNGDDIISIEEKPVAVPGIGYSTVDPQNILVDRPLGKLSYMISAGKEEIYNSKDNLYRDYILFNEDGYEIKTDTNYTGVCSIVFRDATDNGIHLKAKRMHYDVGEINVKQGNCFTLNDEIITFTGKVKNGIIGEINSNCNAKVNDEHVDVYDSVRCIVFSCDDEIENIGIEINDKRIKLKELDYKVSSLNKSVQLDISDIRDGYYKLRIFDYIQNKNVFYKNFVLDSNMKINCTKNFSRNYIINIESNLIGNITRNININNGISTIIAFQNNNEIIEYEVRLNVPLYQIDDGEYKDVDEYIWANDLSNYSKITLINFEFDIIEIKDEKLKNICEPYTLSGKTNIIDGKLLKNFKERTEFYLNLKNSSKVKTYQLWVLNTCKLIDNETFVNYDKNAEELIINTSYIGDESIFVRLKNSSGNVIFEEEITSTVSCIKKENLYSKIYYTLEFFVREQISIFMCNERILGTREIFFMKHTDLIGKYCKINSIRFDDFRNQDKELILNNTFIQFNEIFNKELNIYVGEIYRMQMGEKISFESINPVKIEILTDNYTEVVNCVITTMDDDGLLYNIDKRIFDDIGDRNYVAVNDYDVALIRKREER